MAQRQYRSDEIIGKIQEADVVFSQGMTVSHARRLRELEKEKARLGRAAAELMLEKLILQEAAGRNF